MALASRLPQSSAAGTRSARKTRLADGAGSEEQDERRRVGERPSTTAPSAWPISTAAMRLGRIGDEEEDPQALRHRHLADVGPGRFGERRQDIGERAGDGGEERRLPVPAGDAGEEGLDRDLAERRR